MYSLEYSNVKDRIGHLPKLRSLLLLNKMNAKDRQCTIVDNHKERLRGSTNVINLCVAIFWKSSARQD